ncbi:hypothetical protein FO059_02415 [Tomitella fengzijianii]|uniref:Acetone carboxylase n=1 Tax=Tomitella fengzijianii TaxID=2597660 RepID=A0A516X7B4_9ACTN|nr:hypothetical protein FO059_02415 [Tomitella fengzijianii]
MSDSADAPETAGSAGPEPAPVCSARGCRATALWAVVWNNPRIHTPDREKIWAACDEHRTTLADFLSARSMLLRVEPLAG